MFTLPPARDVPLARAAAGIRIYHPIFTFFYSYVKISIFQKNRLYGAVFLYIIKETPLDSIGSFDGNESVGVS
jgi:hypothetical protein